MKRYFITNRNFQLKLLQFVTLMLLASAFLVGIYPPEILAEGEASVPLSTIGVEAPKNKLVVILIDGLSYRFSNSLSSPTKNKIFGRFTAFKRLQVKEPENIIFRPTIVEGPTFTPNGIQTLNTGAIPSMGLETFIRYAERREGILRNLDANRKNYFFGDPVWATNIRGNEHLFEKINYDASTFALSHPYQAEHVQSIKQLIKGQDYGSIFAHIHQFDATVHLTSLNSAATYKQLE